MSTIEGTEVCAGSRPSRSGTERVGGELGARFGVAQRPSAWTPPAPEVRELQALVRRPEALPEMRAAEANRLEAIIAVEPVRSSVAEHITYLDRHIGQTKTAVREHVNSHPALRRQSELL